VLKPVIVGHHSETTLRLMKPGFHSGTLPKLYAKLRRAERKARPELLPKLLAQLHDVEHAMRIFIERELIATLALTRAFAGAEVSVGNIELGSNRIRMTLSCPSLGERPLIFAFEEQSGWLVAGITRRGWLRDTTAQQRNVFALALHALYARAGVHIARTQVSAAFQHHTYDVAEEGLVVWPGPGFTRKAVYPLRGKDPSVPRGSGAATLGPLPLHKLLFSKTPLSFSLYVNTLERARVGDVVPPELVLGIDVLPPDEPRAAPVQARISQSA